MLLSLPASWKQTLVQVKGTRIPQVETGQTVKALLKTRNGLSIDFPDGVSADYLKELHQIIKDEKRVL